MKVILAWIALVSACSPTPAGPPAPTGPASDASPAGDPAPVERWALTFHSQFFGTRLGPRERVAVDSDGAITVTSDERVLARATLAKADLAALSRLLADPKLAAVRSGDDPQIGPTGGLEVKGDVTLAVRWSGAAPPEVLPLLGEIDRLRDLVAPPESYQIVVTTQGQGVVPGPVDEVRLSSNGYVQTLRDGVKLADHTLPAASLATLEQLLADPALRTATSSEAPGEGVVTTFKMTGDLALDLHFRVEVTGPARPVIAEVLRLGAAVTAKRARPARFTIVYARHDGEGGAPHRVTLGSDGRALLEEPGQPPRTSTLPGEVMPTLAAMLVDPGLRTTLPGTGNGVGKHYEIKVTGDVAFEMSYVGDMPQTVIAFVNRLDWLASQPWP